MGIYKFKVKDFTTVLVGQVMVDNNGMKWFYVQRADGTLYKYDEGIVEWSEKIN